jgi:hypothetical protein
MNSTIEAGTALHIGNAFKEGVVYISSALRQNDWFIVPTSITYLMNSLPEEIPRLGIFSWEITPRLLAENRIFILDCHFLFSLPEVEMLCHLIRQNRPDAQIVLGGYTAQLFWTSLLEKVHADYIILGDNEYSFPRLLSDLYQRQGRPSAHLPNVAGKDFQNPMDYFFSEKDYKDFVYNIDWFPSYRQRVDGINRGSLLHMDHEFYTFPLIVLSKGCSQNCSFCLNSRQHYPKLFNRQPVPMPPYQLHRILREIEAHHRFGKCHLYFNWPLSNYLSMFSQTRFELELNTQIDVMPTVEELKVIAGAFPKASFYVSLGPTVYSNGTADVSEYVQEIENVSFFVSDAQYKAMSQYHDHLVRTTDGWIIPEVFQGLEASMLRARKTFLEFMRSPVSSGFKVILDQRPYYCRHLFNYFGLDDRILHLNRRFRSPDEFLIHRMRSDDASEEGMWF